MMSFTIGNWKTPVINIINAVDVKISNSNAKACHRFDIKEEIAIVRFTNGKHIRFTQQKKSLLTVMCSIQDFLFVEI